MTLSNCKSCKKLFQKRIHDLCTDCIQVDEERFQTLYRRLQKSGATGGVEIVQLAGELDIPCEEIEKFYLAGRLGTAGVFLKFNCQTCGTMMTEVIRRGRYCVSCSAKNSSEAGVEVKSIQDITRQDERERLLREYQDMLRKGDSRAARQFGRSHRIGL